MERLTGAVNWGGSLRQFMYLVCDLSYQSLDTVHLFCHLFTYPGRDGFLLILWDTCRHTLTSQVRKTVISWVNYELDQSDYQLCEAPGYTKLRVTRSSGLHQAPGYTKLRVTLSSFPVSNLTRSRTPHRSEKTRPFPEEIGLPPPP